MVNEIHLRLNEIKPGKYECSLLDSSSPMSTQGTGPRPAM